MKLKQLLMGTRLGKIAISCRSSYSALKTAYYQPEIAGTVANDRMAGYLVTRMIRPDGILVDVGAHLGSVFGEVLGHKPRVRVVAIEAIPDKAAFLRRKFPTATVHECAVGETRGMASFYINTSSSGFSSLGAPTEGLRPQVVEIKVSVAMLDDLISSSEVDFIKIDVEGGELGVLRGGAGLISDSRPAMLFESGPIGFNDLDYTKEDLWQWLADRKYAVLVPNRLAHFDPGLSLEGFLESHLYPRRTTNYFAVPNERRDEFRSRARQVLKLT